MVQINMEHRQFSKQSHTIIEAGERTHKAATFGLIMGAIGFVMLLIGIILQV